MTSITTHHLSGWLPTFLAELLAVSVMRVIQPGTDVRRRAMVLVAALVAGLAVLMLGGPPASADARLVGQHQAVVATADHAVAAVSSPGRHGAEALPPARHDHVKACVLPHRGGGRPLLSASGRVAMFVAVAASADAPAPMDEPTRPLLRDAARRRTR